GKAFSISCALGSVRNMPPRSPHSRKPPGALVEIVRSRPIGSSGALPTGRPRCHAFRQRKRLRGGPQHQVSRVLKGCDILPDDQRAGRAAGIACAASGTTDVVDAIVIAPAVRHQAPVVTSDPGDLAHIADSIGVKIRLYAT